MTIRFNSFCATAKRLAHRRGHDRIGTITTPPVVSVPLGPQRIAPQNIENMKYMKNGLDGPSEVLKDGEHHDVDDVGDDGQACSAAPAPGADRQQQGISEVHEKQLVGGLREVRGFGRIQPDGKERRGGQRDAPCGNRPFGLHA